MESARRRGAKIGRPRRRVDLDRARELRAEGKSLRQVSRELGVPRRRCHGRCREQREGALHNNHARADLRSPLRGTVARGCGSTSSRSGSFKSAMTARSRDSPNHGSAMCSGRRSSMADVVPKTSAVHMFATSTTRALGQCGLLAWIRSVPAGEKGLRRAARRFHEPFSCDSEELDRCAVRSPRRQGIRRRQSTSEQILRAVIDHRAGRSVGSRGKTSLHRRAG
jgi:hypothetical protein